MSDEYRELLIGCGYRREKLAWLPPTDPKKWNNLTTLDFNGKCEPDWLCNLNFVPWKYSVLSNNVRTSEILISSESFDEIHAYEVLEHLGCGQGDVISFFNCFNEIWRILKPNGYLFATTPSRYSGWLWGDPGHTRVIIQETLIFLDRERCRQRMGNSPASDYFHLYNGDFKIIDSQDNHTFHTFCLQAIKPIRDPSETLI